MCFLPCASRQGRPFWPPAGDHEGRPYGAFAPIRKDWEARMAYHILLVDDAPELRRVENCVPVLFLSARDEDEARLRGLGLGADDYLRKPFGAAELRAKVAAHLRRERRERKHALSFGALRLDLASREAYVGEAAVPLTKTEFDVCEFLARHPGQAFSRDQIVENVLGWDAESAASTISVHVANARAKLKAAGAEPIDTVWGVGYKWTA